MFTIPFSEDTIRIPDDVIPGNSTAPQPVEFDICPAGGPDQARLRSLVYADLGLISTGEWSPATQDAVLKAFETSGPVFDRTVDRVRGLTVPAALAHKVGILMTIPEGQNPQDPSGPQIPNRQAKIPILTGAHFGLVAGYMPALAFHVGLAILKLTQKAGDIDPRFLDSPSGSGTAVKPRRRNGSAKRAKHALGS